MLQAHRLAAHLVARAHSIGRITHIFSSDLQRAAKTAQAILDAQNKALASSHHDVRVVKSVDIRERNFGSLEGVKWGPKSAGPATSSTTPFVQPESKEAMRLRVDRFVQMHLQPVLTRSNATAEHSVVVVAHGIILNVLLKSLLANFPPPGGPLEMGISWSNTGYLEAIVQRSMTGTILPPTLPPQGQFGTPQDGFGLLNVPANKSGSRAATVQVALIVRRSNCVEHLQGLQKTKGGIGSAKFDEKQKTMDSFFTRASTTQDPGKDGRG